MVVWSCGGSCRLLNDSASWQHALAACRRRSQILCGSPPVSPATLAAAGQEVVTPLITVTGVVYVDLDRTEVREHRESEKERQYDRQSVLYCS